MLPTSGLFALLAPRKDDILAGAVAQGRIMAGGSQPTIDMVKAAGLEVARQAVVTLLEPQCKAVLDQAALMFPLVHGPRPVTPADDPAYIGWKDQFDEHIMDAIGPEALRMAGQDFIGEYCTESEIDEDTVREAAAQTMARNMVRTAVSDRQPGQVLAEIGIVHDDLIKVAVVPEGGAKPEAQAIAEPVARAHVERLVGAWAIKLGMGAFSVDYATEVLTIAFDDDDFLPLPYIEQLGGTMADAPYFRAYFKAAGKDAIANTANAAMMAALTGAVVEMPKDAPKLKKPKKSATVVDPVVPPPPLVPSVSQPTTKAAGDPDDDIADVFKLLKEHGSDSVDALAAFVGKSRAWMANVISGKTTNCKASAAQRNALLKHLQMRKAGLQAAIDRLS